MKWFVSSIWMIFVGALTTRRKFLMVPELVPTSMFWIQAYARSTRSSRQVAQQFIGNRRRKLVTVGFMRLWLAFFLWYYKLSIDHYPVQQDLTGHGTHVSSNTDSIE